jgi:hypothetical protein
MWKNGSGARNSKPENVLEYTDNPSTENKTPTVRTIINPMVVRSSNSM